MKTLLEILRDSEGYLARHGSPCPRVDAEWLLAHALDCERLQLYLQFDKPMGERELNPLRALLKRRASGEPVQYIVGSTTFYNCKIQVGPGVLVPRHETEVLVELALAHDPGEGPILDLCTGSGAVLLALATALPERRCVGVEASAEALAWAQRNAGALEGEVTLHLGDLFAPVAEERFALITANPPYVTEAEFPKLPADVREHEPREALVAPEAGLAVLRRIAAEAPAHLLPGGWLLCEIGAAHGEAAQALFHDAGLQAVAVHRDYAGRDRIVTGHA